MGCHCLLRRLPVSYLFTGVNLVWSLLLADDSLMAGAVSYSSVESQYTWFRVHSNCSIHPERTAGLIYPIYTLRMSRASCSFLPSSLIPSSSFPSENSQLWSNSLFFHKPLLVSPTNCQIGHPSFHFCPKSRFFPHSQCYSRFHFFRKSTRTNPSLLPNAATFALRWACLLPHPRPPVSRGLCQGSAWEVSSLRFPQGPGLQSTGADADRCLLWVRPEHRVSPSLTLRGEAGTRVTQDGSCPFSSSRTGTYVLRRYDLRRYAETSPRATSRKRQAERKNTKLFGSASRDPVGRRKDFPSGLSFSRRQCRRTSTVQGRGRSGAPRPAWPGPGVRGAPALAQNKGHTARTVSHLPESPSGTRGARSGPPGGDQITSARGGAGAGKARPCEPGRSHLLHRPPAGARAQLAEP